MAGKEIIVPIAGELTRLIPGIRHKLTDVTPDAIARAKDLISREDVLKRVVEQYRQIMPDEFIPVQSIARGEQHGLLDASGQPMLKTILGDKDAMDRTKQIHNLAQKTERQLANDEYLNSGAFYNPNEGRVAINNPYDEVDVGEMMDDSTIGIDYTQVHPLSRAIQEMSQKALQHHGLTDEEKLVLLRKNYAGSRRGSINEPVVSLTSEPYAINSAGFNKMFGGWEAPLNAYELDPRNVMTTDLILPQNFGEREMQVAKQALSKIGTMKRTPGGNVLDYTQYDLQGNPMLDDAFETIDTAQFAYPKLINEVVANPQTSMRKLIDMFIAENGKEPSNIELAMMRQILEKLHQ